MTSVESVAAEEPAKTDATEARPTAEQEELLKVFRKRAPAGAQRVVCPLLVDGKNRGQVLVVLPGAGGQVLVQAAPLLGKLTDVLEPGLRGRLTSLVDSGGNLSMDTLTAAGLSARFDEKKLELHVDVPASLRETSVTNLRPGREPPGLKDAIAPNPFSTYLNLRVGEDYLHRGSPAEQLGRQASNSNLAGAVNVKGLVLEGDVTYTEHAAQPWNRGDVRLVMDDAQRMLRYSAGDVSAPSTGYQRGAKLAGIAVARNFTLQPYRVTEPISQYEFFLLRPSTVEIWVNGGIVRTLQLPPGRHDLRDLPLPAGGSEVRLRIIDDIGREQILSFGAISESELLAAGLHQFAYSFGFPWRGDAGMRSYDEHRPTLSLFHRVGLSNTVTAGAFLQGERERQLAGVQGLWGTRVGLWGLDAAASDATNISHSYAARLRYQKRSPAGSWIGERSWSANVEAVGSHFDAGGESAGAATPYWLDTSASYSQRVYRGIHGALSGSYRFARPGQSDRYSMAFSVGSTLSRGMNLNVTVTQRSAIAGEPERSAFASLTWAIPGTHQQVSASHDTFTETSRAAWRYFSPNSVDSLNASLAAEHSPEDSNVTGNLDYKGYRAEALLSHAALVPADHPDDTELRSSLRFGTALVFAGGTLALSRPVLDSFAIVTPSDQLRRVSGQTIQVNPTRDYDAARVDWLGPGVMPSLYSYQLSTLHVQAPELPYGYELGQSKYDLRPTYKSGFLIKVGTEATVFLRGTLLDAEGVPVTLQAGNLISRDDPKWEPVTMFTNRKGKFAVEGMKPGRFDLNVFSYGDAIIPIEIPEGIVGIYDIGSLKLLGAGKNAGTAETTPADAETIVVETPEEVVGTVAAKVPGICEAHASGAKLFTAYFDTAVFAIEEDKLATCQPTARERLKACTSGVLEFVGYADDIPYTVSSGEDLNLQLSHWRAVQVAIYFHDMLKAALGAQKPGSNPPMFEFRTIGKGSVPLDGALPPEEARQNNRRVDVMMEGCVR